MKTLGLDVGTKTIGIAVSDALGWTAQGIKTLRREENQEDKDIAEIKQLIEEYDISKIVVGLPKNMNGSIGPSAVLCQEFAEQLRSHTGLPVAMWDERLTTKAAERMLVGADVSRKKRKKVIDKMAAVMILQGYLDSQPN